VDVLTDNAVQLSNLLEKDIRTSVLKNQVHGLVPVVV
jgi:hypothetical protein